MLPLLYDALVPWYRLLDPAADHRDEAEVFTAAFERAVAPRPETLLELGAGAGHNAVHLKQRFRCTLTDVSAPMQGLSRALNPDCEHVLGDMRTLRLGRTFDAVLVHDAVMYMTSVGDLRAAITTAFEHTRPGGAAVFAPDCVRETFKESSELHGESADGQIPGRALRCVEWAWDPDPADDTYTVEHAFLLRHGTTMEAVHDRHLEGVFSRATWLELFTSVGFLPELIARPIGDGAFDEVFLARRA